MSYLNTIVASTNVFLLPINGIKTKNKYIGTLVQSYLKVFVITKETTLKIGFLNLKDLVEGIEIAPIALGSQ